MSEIAPTKFNRNLLSAIVLISLVVTAKLVVAAIEFDNVKGAVFSTIHLLAVAVASYLFLRR